VRLATSASELIAFRVIQGAGGGMIMPIGQMILVKKAGPANLPRVMSAIGVPIIMAPVIGPTIGGLLLDSVGWRAIFYVNLPVGIAALIAAIKLLPRDNAEEAGPFDLAGFVWWPPVWSASPTDWRRIGPHPSLRPPWWRPSWGDRVDRHLRGSGSTYRAPVARCSPVQKQGVLRGVVVHVLPRCGAFSAG